MKRVGLIVVFALVAGLAFGQFQGFEWSATQEDVIAKFDQLEETDPYTLTYYDYEAEPNEIVRFSFLENGELAGGQTLFQWETHKIRSAWQYFEYVQGVLIDKYGAAEYDDLELSSSAPGHLKSNITDDPAWAIQGQYGKWKMVWELSDLYLSAVLVNPSDEYIFLVLSYSDPEHREQLNAENQAREKIQF